MGEEHAALAFFRLERSSKLHTCDLGQSRSAWLHPERSVARKRLRLSLRIYVGFFNAHNACGIWQSVERVLIQMPSIATCLTFVKSEAAPCRVARQKEILVSNYCDTLPRERHFLAGRSKPSYLVEQKGEVTWCIFAHSWSRATRSLGWYYSQTCVNPYGIQST